MARTVPAKTIPFCSITPVNEETWIENTETGDSLWSVVHAAVVTLVGKAVTSGNTRQDSGGESQLGDRGTGLLTWNHAGSIKPQSLKSKMSQNGLERRKNRGHRKEQATKRPH